VSVIVRTSAEKDTLHPREHPQPPNCVVIHAVSEGLKWTYKELQTSFERGRVTRQGLHETTPRDLDKPLSRMPDRLCHSILIRPASPAFSCTRPEPTQYSPILLPQPSQLSEASSPRCPPESGTKPPKKMSKVLVYHSTPQPLKQISRSPTRRK
jgi:hypothetical protein